MTKEEAKQSIRYIFRPEAAERIIQAFEEHGQWLGDKDYPKCSVCGCDIVSEYIYSQDYAEIYRPMKYCPNCGADMRGCENG